jgi:hypothetical protein
MQHLPSIRTTLARNTCVLTRHHVQLYLHLAAFITAVSLGVGFSASCRSQCRADVSLRILPSVTAAALPQ